MNPVTQHIFPPLASIVESYSQVWLDTELVDYIFFDFVSYTIYDRDVQYGLTKERIRNDLMRGASTEFLLERKYISGPEVDIKVVAGVVYDLAHTQKVISEEVTLVTLVHRHSQEGIETERKVEIEPANGQFFTVYDLVLGLGRLVDQWKRLVREISQLDDYFAAHGNGHPISLGPPVIIDNKENRLTLLFEIDGLYEV